MSKEFPNLRMTTWNTRSLTFERFQYCKSLNYDVLALTELWRNQEKFQTRRKNFIIGEPKMTNGDRRFPQDKAAGVGILLSDAAERKVESFGSEGERVCWVRLRGPSCNLFIIAVYLPHRGRVAPCQNDTIQDLQAVLRKVPQHDCIIIMGDMNEQLQRCIPNLTGKWCGGEPTKNSRKITSIMTMHDLCAINTYFKPRRKQTEHTYLYTRKKAHGAQDAASMSAKGWRASTKTKR